MCLTRATLVTKSDDVNDFCQKFLARLACPKTHQHEPNRTVCPVNLGQESFSSHALVWVTLTKRIPNDPATKTRVVTRQGAPIRATWATASHTVFPSPITAALMLR